MASIFTAFKFRLYPTMKQEARLSRMIEACRRLWNDALAHRNQRWEEKHQSTTYREQSKILTAERKIDPLLAEPYAQAEQNILMRLERAFKAFFDHRAGYPRFKKFSSSGSLTYPQAYHNGCVELDGPRKRLWLSK
ncbi:MAG: helix-turn-helix domain-containing protein, partial [Thaumarchaeota archaeon]|nr:helix-turn-helix domain-containing protein [Nitrososphaerota archaeon]